MGKYSVALLAPAAAELEAIGRKHLMLVGPKSAEKVTDKILASLERLEQFPNSGAPTPDPNLNSEGYRMVVSGVYVSVYRLIGDTVNVYHIADGRTDYSKLFK